jgi:hypothetical protein
LLPQFSVLAKAILKYEEWLSSKIAFYHQLEML